jgi:hypothetical protein
MWKQIKDWASTVLNLSVVVSALWLAKICVINLPEWKGSTFDFFYEYKLPVGVALSIIAVGFFTNSQGRED